MACHERPVFRGDLPGSPIDLECVLRYNGHTKEPEGAGREIGAVNQRASEGGTDETVAHLLCIRVKRGCPLHGQYHWRAVRRGGPLSERSEAV